MTEESKEVGAGASQGAASGEQSAGLPVDAPPVTAPTPHTPSEAAEDTAADDDGSMTLIAHLTELRSRLIKCLLAIAVGSGVGYYFIDDIMHYLTVPVGKLYYMQPAEAFFTYIKIAVVVGFLLALPVIFYHVWRFFLPALTRAERLVLGIVVPVSVILFFLGLAFSFFLVFPAAIMFFKGFGNEELEALFSVVRNIDHDGILMLEKTANAVDYRVIIAHGVVVIAQHSALFFGEFGPFFNVIVGKELELSLRTTRAIVHMLAY